MSRSLRSQRDDRGVVAIELVLVLPIIIGLLVTSIAFAGLFQTKSRVVGAARDGARASALGLSPDPNFDDGITVVRVGPACPERSNPAYQSLTPPKVTARASTTYDVTIPFVGEWKNIDVTEEATMPCG
jgi:Flp pilus assembly protein TadG